MAEQAPPKRPRGRPSAWDEKALDDLAAVTAADQQAGVDAWDASAPAALRGLLEAGTWGQQGG